MKLSTQKNGLSHSISLLCGAHQGQPGFFEAFRGLARQFAGVDDILVISAEAANGNEPAVTRPGNMFASAPIRVFERNAGELQVYFRIQAFREGSPLPLTKFLAEQLGIALRGSAIRLSNSTLKANLKDLEAEVQEHKLLERARGLIESQRLIPAGKGAVLLQKVAARSGKNLRQLATGILTAAEKNPWRFRKEFYV